MRESFQPLMERNLFSTKCFNRETAMRDELIDAFFDEVGAAPAPANPGQNQTPKAPGNLNPGTPMDGGYIVTIPLENGKKKYVCNIDLFVGRANPYFNLIHILHMADAGDEVVLNLYTYGGSVETGCMIINAMKHTKATVKTVALGICASIGAMIWSCGSIREVSDTATIMFHMPSGLTYGKTADNEEESRQIQEYFSEFMRTATEGLLTADELEKIINRRVDLFIPAATMKARLEQLQQTKTEVVPNEQI